MTSHILVVDDDQSIREALERGLRLEGFNVRSVSNGELAIKAVEENVPSLLVLDINMPEINGIEVIKYLRSIDIDIPICVLSARDEVLERFNRGSNSTGTVGNQHKWDSLGPERSGVW